jgi:hypothetical protein
MCGSHAVIGFTTEVQNGENSKRHTSDEPVSSDEPDGVRWCTPPSPREFQDFPGRTIPAREREQLAVLGSQTRRINKI